MNAFTRYGIMILVAVCAVILVLVVLKNLVLVACVVLVGALILRMIGKDRRHHARRPPR